MIGSLGHVIHACIMIGLLSFLHEVVAQVPYMGMQNVIYPVDSGYSSPYHGRMYPGYNPYYGQPYLIQRPFVGPYSESLSPRYGQGYYGNRGPIYHSPYRGYGRRMGSRLLDRDRVRHYRKKAMIHAAKKRKIKAINAGIFPAVYPHPKIQRHWERKAKKRAKFIGIPKAKSFNGILKDTSLHVSF